MRNFDLRFTPQEASQLEQAVRRLTRRSGSGGLPDNHSHEDTGNFPQPGNQPAPSSATPRPASRKTATPPVKARRRQAGKRQALHHH